MEQLQRLAEVIAETYIRDLRRETGSNILSIDGVSGNVEKHLLAAGLIGITITRAGFGYRRWYICPHCGGRAAKLFIGRKDVGCRKCWSLHYASQSEDELARLRRSVWKQRHNIWGGEYPPAGSLLNSPLKFPKPAGMRWETFEKKRSRLLKTESAYWRLKEPRDAKGFARVMRKAEASIRSFERASKKATP
ncbi:hypothetical protein [Klebsiella michiganensis]|uniref:hypothetical protein n=1 Tax=Klebsiella michiganensis TaxID=1134687 RepID=UPI000444C5D6|nr:hypothetical protein [Klebsiella michiganensis]HBX2473891.1 hypothetical protein [Klebsiella pneumoniae]AHW87586.1 hypothetical protein J415_10345 [Klebsiella michiganensis HKOPL1]MBZ7228099.1 hypothetical protein [Klebsiella michiganensis]SBK86588.1 Uncharacterised protein [Klebsiella michiganensis]SBL53026.1 Uncharacterised protein [Klebsiella michiganensis]